MIVISSKKITDTREQVRIKYEHGITGKIVEEIAFRPIGTAQAWANAYGWKLVH